MARIPSRDEQRSPSMVQSRTLGETASASDFDKKGISRVTNRRHNFESETAGATLRKRRRRRGRSGRSRNHAKEGAIMRRWVTTILILGGTVFSLVMTWTLVKPMVFKKDPPPSTLDGSEANIEPLTTAHAISLAQSMLDARDAKALSKVMFDGELTPELAYKGIQEIADEEGKPGTPQWVGYIDSMTVPMASLAIPYDSNKWRVLLVTPNKDGKWKVDLDSYMRLCSPSLEKIAAGDADEAFVRMIATRDNYFNGPFSDENVWNCYSLRLDSFESTIYGYCKKGSKQDNAMRAVEKRNAKVSGKDLPGTSINMMGQPDRAIPMRVALRLKKVDGSTSQQYEIASVISDDWVVSATPLEDIIEATNSF